MGLQDVILHDDDKRMERRRTLSLKLLGCRCIDPWYCAFYRSHRAEDGRI